MIRQVTFGYLISMVSSCHSCDKHFIHPCYLLWHGIDICHSLIAESCNHRKCSASVQQWHGIDTYRWLIAESCNHRKCSTAAQQPAGRPHTDDIDYWFIQFSNGQFRFTRYLTFVLNHSCTASFCRPLWVPCLLHFLAGDPSPPLDIIWAMVIAWRIRGKPIRTVLCCIV